MNDHDGPKVLVITVPKSGTHLVDSILERIPPLRRQAKVGLNAKLRWHPYNIAPWPRAATCLAGIGRPQRVKLAAVDHALGRIKADTYGMGQLPYDNALMALVERHNLRAVVAIRDPRDVLVSQYHMALEQPDHFLHAEIKRLDDVPSRLRLLIEGTEGSATAKASLGQQLSFIQGWVDHPDVLTVRFEDLVGSRGGGDDDRQRDAIRTLASHVGHPVGDEQAAEIGRRMFGQGKTFRRGWVGGWREYFGDDVAAVFDEAVGDRLTRLGYER